MAAIFPMKKNNNLCFEVLQIKQVSVMLTTVYRFRNLFKFKALIGFSHWDMQDVWRIILNRDATPP